MKETAVFSHFLIENVGFKVIKLTPMWKNRNSDGFSWIINQDLIGRFYNAFLAGNIIHNLIIKNDKNDIVEKNIILYTRCSLRDLEKLDFDLPALVSNNHADHVKA